MNIRNGTIVATRILFTRSVNEWAFKGRAAGRICILTCSLILSLSSKAWADEIADTLLVYAVDIHLSSVTQNWSGYGIYLEKGLFVTAAHVVGQAWLTKPRIVIAGVEYPARLVKQGSFESTDLTVLSVDEKLLPMRLALRRNLLGKQGSFPGEQVVTVVPEAVVHSRIVAPDQLPIAVRKFSTAIVDVVRTGNSGSGVFDVQERCLLGIMSRKISVSTRARADNGKTETRDIAKYFVPASEIAAFLPADVR